MKHVVNDGFFHIRRIGIIVIQDQFIKSETGLTFDKMVKFQLQAVPVTIRIHGDRRKAGIALRTYPDRVEFRTVDHDITGIIFLRCGIGKHLIPLVRVHQDIDTDDLIGIKQLVFIFQMNSGTAHGLREFIRKNDRKEAQYNSHCRNCGNDLVYVFICDHDLPPDFRLPH